MTVKEDYIFCNSLVIDKYFKDNNSKSRKYYKILLEKLKIEMILRNGIYPSTQRIFLREPL